MPIEIPKDKWPGAVRTITLGATAHEGGTHAHAIAVGGWEARPIVPCGAKVP